ncbi:uncharacterized protein YALI1_F04655g [Yarrowia lipolytica]|uniref:Uncharacterized protein n=1 Tax=Yarrowia lipolytica TaxID=4952 RepID=A0A1D8NLR9_YARLL|nr:hypothetical protein YALI1_F04655g [Yarrowia lipolytica]
MSIIYFYMLWRCTVRTGHSQLPLGSPPVPGDLLCDLLVFDDAVSSRFMNRVAEWYSTALWVSFDTCSRGH